MTGLGAPPGSGYDLQRPQGCGTGFSPDLREEGGPATVPSVVSSAVRDPPVWPEMIRVRSSVKAPGTPVHLMWSSPVIWAHGTAQLRCVNTECIYQEENAAFRRCQGSKLLRAPPFTHVPTTRMCTDTGHESVQGLLFPSRTAVLLLEKSRKSGGFSTHTGYGTADLLGGRGGGTGRLAACPSVEGHQLPLARRRAHWKSR